MSTSTLCTALYFLLNNIHHGIYSSELAPPTVPSPQLKLQKWNRIVRFVASDDRVLLGEPKDETLDIGLAIADGQTVEVYVLAGEHIWDINVIRTGEEAVVKKVSRVLSGNMRHAETCPATQSDISK